MHSIDVREVNTSLSSREWIHLLNNHAGNLYDEWKD